MRHIILLSVVLFLILGCGVMNSPQEEERIHVPQDITVKLPDILTSDNNKTNREEKKKPTKRWYN